jgi:hypothetical protein
LKCIKAFVACQKIKAVKLFAASSIGLVCVLASVASAHGQVMPIDRLYMTLNGSLGASYEGSFGNSIDSSHGLGFGTNADLDGYYFNPNFLGFHIRPYYDRVQSNADSQTVTRGTGVESSISAFGGSHFPGSISYGRDFSRNSEFRIAGVPSVLGNAAGSNLDIAWSALFENRPSLHANYLITDSSSSLLGTTGQNKSSSRSLGLNSDYKLGGFTLHGSLNHYNTNFLSPSFMTGTDISNTSSSTNYSATAMRRLPFSGSLALGWSRSASENGGSDSTNNSYSASAVFMPWSRLVVSESWNYTTNVVAAIAQSLGGDAGSTFFDSKSGWNAMYMNTTSTLMLSSGLTISGHMNHRIQHFQGRYIGDTQYGGSVNFRKMNRFFGFLNCSVGLVDTATQEGNSGIGLVSTLSMTRKFGNWDTAADFSYSQDTQTLYSIATTSNYSFGGALRRKVASSTYWSASFRESRSGLTVQEGNNNVSQAFATNFSWRKYTLSGSYSQSNGMALLAADGTLTATPLGSILSNYFLTFNARSFGINSRMRLFRTLTLFGGYTKVSSDSTQNGLGTFNKGDRYNARLELRLRRLNIFAGFDRAVQNSSTVPGGPRAVNSYYVSLSRWFNVF